MAGEWSCEGGVFENSVIMLANGESATCTIVNNDIMPVLVVTKSNGVEEVEAGESYIYTITVENVGNQEATNVIVTDSIPAYTTSEQANEDGDVIFEVGTLEVNGSRSYEVTVVVDETIPAGVESITNTVVATADEDLRSEDEDTDELIAEAELEVTKSNGVEEMTAGESYIYTITVRNIGDQDATGVVVVDTLPEGLTSEDAVDGVVTFEIGDLAAGAMKIVYVEVTVDGNISSEVEELTNVAVATDDEDHTAEGSDTDDVRVPEVLGVAVEPEVKGVTLAKTGSQIAWLIAAMGLILVGGSVYTLRKRK